MYHHDEFKRKYIQDDDLYRSADHEDTELALQLQNIQLDDQNVLDRIIYHYAAQLYKWAGVLLYYHQLIEPRREEILDNLKAIFVYAFKHANQFHGQASVINWLFGISHQVIKNNKSKTQGAALFTEQQRNDFNGIPVVKLRDAYWKSVDRLPEKLIQPLLLRYLFDFGIPDIAQILNLQINVIHERLVAVRKSLMVNKPESHIESDIQEYLDDLLDDKQIESGEVDTHIAHCTLCQTYVSKFTRLEKTLSEELKRRWDFPVFQIDEIQTLAQTIYKESNRPKRLPKFTFPIRQTAWIAGIILVFVGLAIQFIRLTPVEREFPQQDSTNSPQLPPLIVMRPATTLPQNTSTLRSRPQFIEPDFSSDGNWGVFASIKIDPITQQTLPPTIELFDRASNTIQVISESTATLNLPWVWWNLAPSISSDGRWIAYASAKNDPNINGYSCKTINQHSCLDIFLHERETGLSKRITHGADGSAANGDSFSPTVSADGKWVAFWSAATNLEPGVDVTCQNRETAITCLYIYLYSQDTGKVERIPIPTFPGDSVYGVDRISLSADARFVGFTISSIPQSDISSIGDQYNIEQGSIISSINNTFSFDTGNNAEAVVYDRETGNYELENQSQDGKSGDGDSSSPVLSANGRFVAFVSASTNLVKGDVNKYSDVFLRNRESGRITLVSARADNVQGNGDSGLTLGERGYYSINISNNGRYVVFESDSTNLDQNIDPECNHFGVGVCKVLYVHDMQTNRIEWISAMPNGDFSLFPEISSNGHWITFMQSVYNCSSTQFLCSDVMLYDLKRGWMTNLTKYKEDVPTLPWLVTGSLRIPWELWDSKAITFSSDGKLLALGGIDSSVRIWQINDENNSLRENQLMATLDSGGNEPFSVIAFTSDGQWIAGGTEGGTVYVWHLPDGKLLYKLKEQTGLIKNVIFSQDGSQLVITTLNGSWVWQIGDRELINVNQFSYGTSNVYAIDISPVGNILASAREDGSVWLQSLPGGEVIGRLGGSQVVISELAFSNDGTQLATRSLEGVINLWQIEMDDSDSLSITALNSFQSTNNVGALSFSPDNKYLATTGTVGQIMVWSVPDGDLYSASASFPIGKITSLTFSDEGKLAIVIENEIVLCRIPIKLSSTFFVPSSLDTYFDFPPLQESFANDIPQFQSPAKGAGDEHLTLNQVARHFPLIIPTRLPEDINFQEARINQDDSVTLRFTVSSQPGKQSTLYIYEKVIGSSQPPTMSVGENAEILHTRIATIPGRSVAEYVRGDWLSTRSFIPPSIDSPVGESHDVWRWDNASSSQRLRWMQYGLLIAMYYQTYNTYVPVLIGPEQGIELFRINTLLTKEDFEQIALWMMLYSEAGL